MLQRKQTTTARYTAQESVAFKLNVVITQTIVTDYLHAQICETGPNTTIN